MTILSIGRRRGVEPPAFPVLARNSRFAFRLTAAHMNVRGFPRGFDLLTGRGGYKGGTHEPIQFVVPSQFGRLAYQYYQASDCTNSVHATRSSASSDLTLLALYPHAAGSNKRMQCGSGWPVPGFYDSGMSCRLSNDTTVSIAPVASLQVGTWYCHIARFVLGSGFTYFVSGQYQGFASTGANNLQSAPSIVYDSNTISGVISSVLTATWDYAWPDDDIADLGRDPFQLVDTPRPWRMYFDLGAGGGAANEGIGNASGTSAAGALAGSVAAASVASTATGIAGSIADATGAGQAAGRAGAIGSASGVSVVSARAGSVASASSAGAASAHTGAIATAAGSSTATAYSSAASIASAVGTSAGTARAGSIGQSTGTSSAAGYSSAASIAAAAGSSTGLAVAGFIAASTAASTAIAVSGAIAAAVGSSSAAATSGTVNSGAGGAAGTAGGAAISGAVARAFGSATCVAISSMPSTLLFPARVCIAARQPANVAVNASILACSCTN